MATDEKIEIEESRQAEILELFARVGKANHFDLLGLPVGAPADQVKKAFHEISKKFHPDRFFGKNLGSFRVKLDTIFKALVDAQSVLGDAVKRKAYLDANPHLKSTVAAPVAPAAKSDLENQRDAERRARLTRHPYLARVNKLQDTLNRAKTHVEKGEYEHAYTLFNMASQMDPDNAEVRHALIEVRKKGDLSRSVSELARGKKALDQGDDETALTAFRSALSSNVANDEAAYKLSILLEKRGASGQEIASPAQKAVDAQPKNVEYRLILARALEKGGMKVNAKAHFDEAARLNPEHPEVKKQGKKRWPF